MKLHPFNNDVLIIVFVLPLKLKCKEYLDWWKVANNLPDQYLEIRRFLNRQILE